MYVNKTNHECLTCVLFIPHNISKMKFIKSQYTLAVSLYDTIHYENIHTSIGDSGLYSYIYILYYYIIMHKVDCILYVKQRLKYVNVDI